MNSYRLPSYIFEMMLNPLEDLISVGVRPVPVDVLQVDVPLRVGEHVRNGSSDGKETVFTVCLDEIFEGASQDPEIFGGRRLK